MKIILTVHQFLPHYSSGTEILTYETAKELRRHGHEVSIFTGMPTLEKMNDAERFGSYVYDNIPIEYFSFNRMPTSLQTNPFEMEYDDHLVGQYFKNYLERVKPDIVHFFHLAHLSASPIESCYQMGIPTLFTPTDFWFMCPLYELRFPQNKVCSGPDGYGMNCFRHYVAKTQSPLFNSVFQRIPNTVLRPFIALAIKKEGIDKKYSPIISALSKRRPFLQKKINLIDKVIIPTEIMFSNLVRNGLEASRVVKIPFGINLEYIQPSQRNKLTEEVCLGYIGTLSEHKGVHVLINAVRRLPGKKIKLKIYGKINEMSGYYKNLRQMAEGDSRIEFCGTFPNNKIGEIFSDMDALVVPSLWHENSPLVIYSAQYAKCPVIASNMAGMAEVIKHGVDGLLFEAGNEIDLSKTIESLLDSPDLLRHMSANAPRPLSIQEYSNQIITVYYSLLRKEIQ